MNPERCRLKGCGAAIQFVTVFFCSLNVINAGLEYGWTSAAFPVLLKLEENKTEPLVTSEQGVWIATLPLPGAVIGASVNAFVCDIVGRKPFILFTTIPYAIHWILISVANGAPMYYIARVLCGFSSGMALSAIPMYTGEISNPKFRGRLCAVAPMCIVIGVFLINLFCIFLTIQMAALVALTFSSTSFLGLLFMPESPYFYLMKNKEEKALRSLRIFEGKRDVESDLQRMKQAVQEQNEKTNGGFKALVKNRVDRRSVCIVAFLRAAQPLCGITTLVYYSSVILGENASNLSVKYATMAFTVALMIAVIIGLSIVDVLGRRPLILFSLAGSFVGLTVLAIYIHLKSSDVDTSSFTFIPLFALIMVVSFYGVGLQQIPYVLQGELFATSVKASGVALGLIVFCVFSLLSSKYFQHMNDKGKGHITIYTFAVFSVVTFVFVLFCMPETKDLSLEDVQIMMEQRKLHFKDVVNSPQ
ncbi:facilitated trehalose transporter Tret1-like [Coccinella septempunctata]|uniref:facilitated trehalose transporter Tret1-like n=1 Tax=Coccinella septempunctata TaxID=41139 RepID=UPI001D06A86C|nr:facilitated trehalose transporter Tret1-like [Coccinella septempunctata]